MMPYIGPEIVEVLRARQTSPELAPPVFPKRSPARQNTSKPISFLHMPCRANHSNALVVIVEMVTRWLL